MPAEDEPVTTRTPLRPCPQCGSTDAIRIAYGYPTFEMGEAADRGEIRLGGCVIGPESPDYECLRCNAQLPWVAVDTEPVDEDAPRQDSLGLDNALL